MIHLDLNLFYEVFNAINQHYQKQIHFFSLTRLDVFDVFLKENQKFLK